DHTAAQELHVLPLPVDVGGDDRGISGAVAAGNLTFPDHLSGFLIEGDQGRLLAARSTNELVTVNQRGFAIAPAGHHVAAEVLGQIFPPQFLAGHRRETNEIAMRRERVNSIAIYRGGAARAAVAPG